MNLILENVMHTAWNNIEWQEFAQNIMFIFFLNSSSTRKKAIVSVSYC